jgi:hypothetical protein
MCERFILMMKISRLSCMVKSMESNIIKYRQDMSLMNDLYYCGRGDVDTYINEWSNEVYRKIAACDRLKLRYERRMDKLNGVVGA